MIHRAWLVCLVSVLAFYLSACVNLRPAPGNTLLVTPDQAQKLGFWPMWSANLDIRRIGGIAAAAILDDQLVAIESQSNMVTALSVKDGAVRWRQAVGDRSERLVGVAAYRKQVLVVSETSVYLLEPADGKVLTVSRLEQEVHSNPIIAGDYAIFGGVQGKVFAHDMISGLTQWAYQMGGPISVSLAALPLVVFIADDQGNLVMLGASKGDLQWYSRTHEGQGPSGAPLLTPTAVYVASLDHSLYSLSRTTGKDRWVYRTNDPLDGAPVISGNSVILPLPSGQLVALRTADGTEQWRAPLTTLPRSILPLGSHLLLILDKKIQALDPATGKSLHDIEVPEGIQYVLPGPAGSLIVIAPTGRVIRLDPRS